ncbi:MAG: hypothetical protein H6568_11755 [Lewinellaceae bacterium]|nr:hypothetical protein [Lewinellaceae bacterium]
MLLNVMGQPIRFFPLVTGTNRLDIAGQPPGMYVLHGNGLAHRLIIH